MTLLRLIITLLMVSTATAALAAGDYFTLEEYYRLHPEQAQRAKPFSELVRSPGRPVASPEPLPKIRISVIYPGKQASDYWRRSVAAFRKRLEQIGIPHTIDEYFSTPGVDYRVQEAQIRTALSKDPDYLVFTLDAKKHQRVIERIITRSRPRLILQNITTPLKRWEGKQPFLYVGFDHATGARMLADYFLKKTGHRGKYAVAYFTMGYVSAMRGDTFIDYISRRSDLELAEAFYTDGKREKAREGTLRLLEKSTDIAFIYACATDVALGVVDALLETGNSGRILINGWGGGSSELEAIAEGTLDVTVMRINDDNGVAMAEAIRLDVEKQTEAVPVVYSGDFVLVEKGIAETELKRLKTHAFRLSGME